MKAHNTTIGFSKDRTHLFSQLRQLKVTKPLSKASIDSPRIIKEYHQI